MEVGDTIISKVLLFYSIIDSPMHMGETYLSRWDYTVRVRGWFFQDKGGGVRAAKCLCILEARWPNWIKAEEVPSYPAKHVRSGEKKQNITDLILTKNI